MAKIVVQNDANPDIGIVLTENREGPVALHGWSGECTQCEYVVFWRGQLNAIRESQLHVNTHNGEE